MGAPERASASTRLSWARQEWQRDIAIPVAGPGGMVSRMMSRFGEAASVEALQVIFREERSKRPAAGVPRAVTSLGDKLGEALAHQAAPQGPKVEVRIEPPVLAIVPQEQPPAATGKPPGSGPEHMAAMRKKAAQLPAGAKSYDARAERMEWARAQFRLRPHMNLGGEDGIKKLLTSRFGVALRYEDLASIRHEVRREMGIGAEPVTPEPEPEVTTSVTTALMQPADVDAALGDIVARALEAIPALASLTITVDESGTTSVSYRVREVRVVESTGGFQVKRKP